MSKRIYYVLSLVLVSMMAMVSCNSDDDGQEKIQLGSGQAKSITVPAGQAPGEIRFSTTAAWSACVQETPAGGEVEWLRLGTSSGDAGSTTVTFTLEPNDTGASRTAYIIITCEDQKITITVTQAAGNSGDEPNPSKGKVEIICTVHYPYTNSPEPEVHKCVLEYLDGKPQSIIHTYREDLGTTHGSNSYSRTEETWTFAWKGDEVAINSKKVCTYYPSGEVDIDEESQRFARLADGRAMEGNYIWKEYDDKYYDEDERPIDWVATYDASGYLKSTKSHCSDPVLWTKWDFTWKDGDLQETRCTEDEGEPENNDVTKFIYGDPSLLNLHQEFDLNWILPAYTLENLCFSTGDESKPFVSFGLMGKRSRHLATEILEKMGSEYGLYIDYKVNTPERTEVTVTERSSTRDTFAYYYEWVINYTNIK